MAFNPNEHLMLLKDKKYLQVMWRLVWFRDEKPNWGIDTKLEQLGDTFAVFSAKIYDENGTQKSAGYGSESVKDFRDYIEKAETKAVGRALAMLGYGTQFAPEMDEGERIVDSPVQRGKTSAIPATQNGNQADEAKPCKCERCQKEIASVRKKNGDIWKVQDMVAYSKRMFGFELCADCMKSAQEEWKRNGG